MQDNRDVLFVALLAACGAYGVLSSPACGEVCQQAFGTTLSESTKIATAAVIALTVHAMRPQPRRRRRRA